MSAGGSATKLSGQSLLSVTQLRGLSLAGKPLLGWRDPGNSSETCRKDLERRDDVVPFVLEPGEPMLARSRR